MLIINIMIPVIINKNPTAAVGKNKQITATHINIAINNLFFTLNTNPFPDEPEIINKK